MAEEKKSSGKQSLSPERAFKDFQLAYRAKRPRLERQQEDFRYALGDQWSPEDAETLKKVNIKPFTDNRIAPNLFLLTGLERQNRAEFKAFPIGEEDGIVAEITSLLFKDAIRKSNYQYKSSEQFKDGITCGESHLELYLDNTKSLLNGEPCWHKCDSSTIFPDPSSREYDFSDARYVYKLKIDISMDDLINLFPKKEAKIRKASSGKIDLEAILGNKEEHQQRRDYPTEWKKDADGGYGPDESEKCFDLLERYYRKFVPRYFIADRKTGSIDQMEDQKAAEQFIAEYRMGINQNLVLYQEAVVKAAADAELNPGQPVAHPPAPPEQDPNRFFVMKRSVPEMWRLAVVPGVEEPLDDSPAWFYPNWDGYPFIPYYARLSTAPLKGDERHLLVQGLVHGVKGAQEKHNKAEILLIRHLNTSANSGWLAEEGAWVDPEAVRKFGTSAGVSLEYKKGFQIPQRITPAPLSQAHAQISLQSAESIKDQLGINADLLAANEGGGDSGRAISLRQKQGLLMVQELFDNLTRSRQLAGRFLLSQLGEIYDTETAMKVLGKAYLVKNFPAPLMHSEDPNVEPQPMVDPETGRPMEFDKAMAETEIARILQGDLGKYDVTVGESVASETQRLANSAELAEFAKLYPGLIPPQVIIKNSQLPENTKKEILEAMLQQQQLLAAQAQAGAGKGKPPKGE